MARPASSDTTATDRLAGPDPARAARREVWIAVWELLRGFASVPGFWIARGPETAAIRRDLEAFPPEPEEPPLPDLAGRRPTILISCAEASGELHAARLAEELTEATRVAGGEQPRLLGFGGEELRAAGVTTLADPGAKATMDAGGALSQLPFYRDLLERCARTLRDERPDVFVPVDSPALHVPMANLARRYGVPVVHHITPQYWAWAPWRVRRYARVVDRALTILPFESAWFDRHGVSNAYVGHPIRDQHARRPKPPPAEGRNVVLLLPGSRAKEVDDNLPFLLRALAPLRSVRPDASVVVAQRTDEHRARIEALLADAPDVRLSIGDLEGDLGRARVALAVSGTVLMEVARHTIPTVVVYRVTRKWKRALRWMLTVPWFAGVNLVAGEAVLPEFAVVGEGDPEPVGAALATLDAEGPERERVVRGLERAFRRLGEAGAARRAARHVLAYVPAKGGSA